MTATEASNARKLDVKYYRSFASYEIPFRPDGEVPFAATEGMRSFYLACEDPEGRVVEFVKLILVREAVREMELAEPEESGSAIFFRVNRRPDSPNADPGERIVYPETENLTEFFEGEVGASGRDCRVALFRKEIAFRDVYRYWPNGNLRERILTRRDDSKAVWHFDEGGDLLNGRSDQTQAPDKSLGLTTVEERDPAPG